MKLLLLACAAVLNIAAPLAAQTYGEITGTATDASGALVVGAAIQVTNNSTGQVRSAVTNQSGNYTVPFLTPGAYAVSTSASGFRTASRRDIVVQVGAVVRIDFTLEIGDVAQTIEVSGGAPLLTTENAALGTVIENKRIVELPLNGRNYLQLIALSPNVSAEMGAGGQGDSRQGGDRANQAFSIAGQRQQFNNFTLDGVENTDVNFNTFIIRPSIDALQEFKVQTGVYSAEFGRSTSQVNATTKSGSNAYHGTLFEFLRNDVLDAREWRNSGIKNPFRRNQFGFTFAGPILRERLFFMSNFEALRDRKSLQQVASVATSRMRAGDFAGQRQIFDPLTRVFSTDAQGNERAVSATPFPGNQIPRSRFNPISQKMLEFYPEPTVPSDSILRNYVRNAGRPISMEQFTQRIDWTESTNSSWFGRFSWGDEYVGQTATFPTQQGRTTTKTYQALMSNTRIFGPTVVNEFRFGYSQFQNDQIRNALAYERNVSAELGIAGVDSPPEAAWGEPSVGFSDGLTGFGADSTGPYVNRNHIFQWIDTLSVVRGKHSFKMGGELRRDRFNQFGNDRARGQFTFNPNATANPAARTTTGHSFADLLLGEATVATRAVGTANVLLRGTYFSFFFEDTWRMTSKLTVNVGLRYEHAHPWYDKYRGLVNLSVPSASDPAQVPVMVRPGNGDFYENVPFRFADGIPTATGDDVLGRSLVQPEWNDFAPRLGIAYSPNSRWSIRTGFGVFFAQDQGNAVFDMGRNLGGRDDATANRERPNVNVSAPWRFQQQAFRCSNWDGPCIGAPFAFGNIVDRATPYVMQYLFNVQRQLTPDISLGVGYQGNAGHKLQRMRYFGTAVPKTGPNDARTPEQRRPWIQYSRIQEPDNVVNSNYNALGVKLQQRFSRGLTYLFGYTFAKSIDGGSSIRTHSGDRLFAMNQYDLASERALSQFDTRNRATASIIYELPFGSSKRIPAALRYLTGGWQVGSILTLSDGTPWGLSGIGDTNNIGVENNYPNATGISPFPDNPTTERFWVFEAFDAANPELSYKFGNVGRNVLKTPGFKGWDFSLVKNTRITEGQSLQFRFEAFNFPNHPNWNTPNANATNRAVFGVITSARTMREMQFGLKYSF